ncbi:MAG: hypothetical protein OEO84_05115 [Betaproteobacteria bacterium]|nr:hypothetical protein [Betaproteobacteria bacterium]
MSTADISAIARHLFETHGAKAIAEAAQKAVSFEHAGDEAQAKLWRRVEAAVRELRGPKES